MPGVFLCDRGNGSRHLAERLGDRLRNALGAAEVVQPHGQDPAAVGTGSGPLRGRGRGARHGARFDEPDDPVRRAVEATIDGGQTVIPVLADDANFPAETSLPPSLGRLVYQNGVRVRADDRFGADVARLLQGVRRLAVLAEPPTPVPWLADVLARGLPGMIRGSATATALSLVATVGGVDEPVHGVVSVRPGAHRTRDPGGAGACGWGEVRRAAAPAGLAFGAVMPLLQLAGCFFAGTAVEAVVNVVRGATNRGTSILSMLRFGPRWLHHGDRGTLRGGLGRGATVGRWPGSESDGTGGGGRGCGGPGCGPCACLPRPPSGSGALARAAHLRRDRGSDAMGIAPIVPLVGAELPLPDVVLGRRRDRTAVGPKAGGQVR